jgi:hypothetical protein
MRTLLKRRGVRMVGGVEYVKIDDAGLQIIVEGKSRNARPRFSPDWQTRTALS